ncbi:MAG: cellulase family glycosylhydrolase [candidate division Zixibacteria bacterium]|nr:cellulase family glycosylhydrolase [candidate division Zixibacteria bacterium]
MRSKFKKTERSMKRHLLLTLFLLFTFNLPSFSGSKSPEEGSQQLAVNYGAEYPQEFRVVENKIVDRNGEPKIFRGLDMVTITHLKTQNQRGKREYLDWGEEIFRQMNNWGSEITRIQIHPNGWARFGREGVIRLIDQAIEWSSNYNMYIFLQYNIIGFPPTQTYGNNYKAATKNDILEFWNFISEHYKDSKVIAFYELINEPTSTRPMNPTLEDWLLWKEFAEEIIDTIRSNDPNSVIIVNGLYWGYDISYAIDHPIDRENIVYGTHPYPQKALYKSWEEAFGAVADKYPVFVTEFGFDYISFLKDREVQKKVFDFLPHLKNVKKRLMMGQFEESDDKIDLMKEVYRDILSHPKAMEYLREIEEKYRIGIKQYLERKGISWTAFCFSPRFRPSLLQNGSYVPTESGKFFRDWLLEKNIHK